MYSYLTTPNIRLDQVKEPPWDVAQWNFTVKNIGLLSAVHVKMIEQEL